RRSADFLKANGYDLAGFKCRVIPISEQSDDRLAYLQKTVGLEKAKAVIRSGEIPFAAWRVVWYQDISRYLSQQIFYVRLTSDGKVVGLDYQVPDDWAAARLPTEKAKEIAVQFLQGNRKIDLEPYHLDAQRTERREHRTDHSFTWLRQDSRFPDAKLKLFVEIKGDRISRYNEEVEISSRVLGPYQKEFSLATFYNMGSNFVLP